MKLSTSLNENDLCNGVDEKNIELLSIGFFDEDDNDDMNDEQGEDDEGAWGKGKDEICDSK